MSPMEKEYANARLSGKIKSNDPRAANAKGKPSHLEEIFQKGGAHQYSPPADKEAIIMANIFLLTAGGAAISTIAIGAIGVGTITTTLADLGLQAGTFLAVHPRAGKLIHHGIEFAKGYFLPLTEAPQSNTELIGISTKKILENSESLIETINEKFKKGYQNKKFH